MPAQSVHTGSSSSGLNTNATSTILSMSMHNTVPQNNSFILLRRMSWNELLHRGENCQIQPTESPEEQ
jgi:hypothetical protein